MIIQFAQGSNAAAILADDLGEMGEGRKTALLGDWGGEALSDSVPIADADFQRLFKQGNVRGTFSFTATKSHASLAAMLTYWHDHYALLGGQDELQVIRDTAHLFMQRAVLRSVRRSSDSNGLKLSIQYTFDITTIELTN